MSLAERQDDLIRLLRLRADWRTEDLAHELGVSTRTILRDLDRLRDRGFEISTMSGPGGGVHLEPTSVLVTSQLAGEDVVALILSAAVAQAFPWMPFASGATAALAKIESSLPHHQTFVPRPHELVRGICPDARPVRDTRHRATHPAVLGRTSPHP